MFLFINWFWILLNIVFAEQQFLYFCFNSVHSFVMISITWQSIMWTSEQNHEILFIKWFWTSFRFWISNMKIFSEIFDFVYKIILHLTLLLTEQHELMIFKSELNVIHKIDDNYIFMKHCFSMLNDERMRRLKFKVNKFYITIQSVRQISWHDRSVNEAV